VVHDKWCLIICLTNDDKKLDRIIGYIAGTKHLKLHITHTDLELFGQFDAAFATHTDSKSVCVIWSFKCIVP